MGRCSSGGRFMKLPSWRNIDGLNRFTLQYPTAGEEAGYLHYCNRKLLEVWPATMVVYALFMLALIAGSIRNFGLPWQQSEHRALVEMTLFCFRLGAAVQAVLQIIISKSSKLLKCIGNIYKESSIVLLCTYTSIGCLGRFYFAKILGHDPYMLFSTDELPSSYTDTLFVLQLFTVLTISHVLPLRWCSLLVIEIAIPVIYGLTVCLAWTPEPKKWTCFLQFLLLVFLSSYGKRKMEMNDRLVFSSLLNEKTLRAKAEFELSQQQKPKDNTPSNCQASVASTTGVTQEIFAGLHPEADLQSSLNGVFNIGKSEQWIIDENELVVDTEAVLGMGGFGIVLAGEFHSSPVALKIHKSNGMQKNLFSTGNELRLLRKLRHSNIVLFHGACLNLAQNDIVLVMERVVGVSMSTFVDRMPSTPEHLKVLTGTCHALMYLHSRKPAIAHGDLKPANIMIEQRGDQPHAKILDFGLARLITRKVKGGGGTKRWMAPELFLRNSRPSTESDMFALGLVIYFASTGQLPFEGKARHVGSKNGSGSALVWPVEASEFAANCMPIADLATRELPQERPIVQDVNGMLVEVGRCDSSQSIGRQWGSDLWEGLRIARQAVSTKESLSQRFKVGRWFENVKIAEKFPSQGNLKPIKEEHEAQDAVGAIGLTSSTNAESLLYPGLVVTPAHFMKVSLLEALVSWNICMPSSTCCEYHSVLAMLGSIHQELQTRPCKRLRNPGSAFEQCPVCCMVSPKESEPDPDAEMCCIICGFTGQPRQCATPQRTDDNCKHGSPLQTSSDVGCRSVAL